MVVGEFFSGKTSKGWFEFATGAINGAFWLSVIFGTFFGALAGGFVGFMFGLNRHEDAAPQTGAFVAGVVPALVFIAVLFHPQVIPFGVLVLIWVVIMAAIGFTTGMVFRNRLQATT